MKGKLSVLDELRLITPIKDVDLYGDGVLYTINVRREWMIALGSRRKVSPKAVIISVVQQDSPEPRINIDIPIAVIAKAQKWFKK